MLGQKLFNGIGNFVMANIRMADLFRLCVLSSKQIMIFGDVNSVDLEYNQHQKLKTV
jgi:hypothetical protein